jgi:hypothetical protein
VNGIAASGSRKAKNNAKPAAVPASADMVASTAAITPI